MTPENKPIEISEKIQIDLPASRTLMSVDKTDWNRIKRMIGQINDNYNRWENSAWATASLFLGLLIACITTADQPTKTYFGISAIAFLVISALLFFVSHYISKTLTKSKEDVLFEISDIEKKFPINSTTKTVSTNGLEILSAIYGTSKNSIDIARALSEQIMDEKLNIKVSNEIGGDPDVGVMKELTIGYINNGQEFKKTVAEGQNLIIP